MLRVIEPVTAAKAAAVPVGWLAGIASFPILGINGSALVAALFAAALNNTDDPATADRNIPARLTRTLADAMIGGWLAMLVINLPAFGGYEFHKVGAPVVAALMTLCVPWFRKTLPGYGGRFVDYLFGLLPGRKDGK